MSLWTFQIPGTVKHGQCGKVGETEEISAPALQLERVDVYDASMLREGSKHSAIRPERPGRKPNSSDCNKVPCHSEEPPRRQECSACRRVRNTGSSQGVATYYLGRLGRTRADRKRIGPPIDAAMPRFESLGAIRRAIRTVRGICSHLWSNCGAVSALRIQIRPGVALSRSLPRWRGWLGFLP